MDAAPTALSLFNLAPLGPVALVGALLALGPLAWLLWQQKRGHPNSFWQALTVITLFLTFDLILFGAFTRLTDSGLGCPDWPGCYGQASPLTALADITAAHQAMPTGAVSEGKAWIEMVHRYLATAVGALIVLAWLGALFKHKQRRAWATLTLLWVLLQGAFGAFTVTLKLFPAPAGGAGVAGLVGGAAGGPAPARCHCLAPVVAGGIVDRIGAGGVAGAAGGMGQYQLRGVGLQHLSFVPGCLVACDEFWRRLRVVAPLGPGQRWSAFGVFCLDRNSLHSPLDGLRRVGLCRWLGLAFGPVPAGGGQGLGRCAGLAIADGLEQCGVGLALVGGGAAHGGGCGFAGLVGLVLVHQSKSGQRAAGPGTDFMDFYLWLK